VNAAAIFTKDETTNEFKVPTASKIPDGHTSVRAWYSLCDAVSFVLTRERGIREALTTDRHFEQEGTVRSLAPQRVR
jgi:predicted nucleic acid-binding protein